MTVPDTRFFRRGITKVYVVPTIAAFGAPTVAEIGAGTDVSPGLADITGFQYTNTPIGTPDISDSFDTNIPGVDATAASTLKWYEQRVTNTYRDLVAKGTALNIVIFWGGLAGDTPAADDACEQWPVIATGPFREYTMAATAAMWGSGFAASARPAVDAAVTA